MHSQTLARSLAAGAVLLASALVLIARLPTEAPPVDATHESFTAPGIATDVADAGAEPDARPVDEQAAVAKIRELQAMSETFRNSTFLIAIRDAGFVCNELLRISGGLDDSPKWMATCSETLAYTIGVADNGTLSIRPFMQYFDGLTPRVVEQEFFEPDTQPVLPPQTLPQR